VSAPMLAAAPGILLAGEIMKLRMDHPGTLSPVANSVTANILKVHIIGWCHGSRSAPGASVAILRIVSSIGTSGSLERPAPNSVADTLRADC
jgi:hypothetical protein